MKKFKFLLFGIALTVVTMFSSCMDDNTTPNTSIAYVTVAGGYLGTEYLIQDIYGKRMIAPTASMVTYGLNAGDRAIIKFKLQDGFVASSTTADWQIDILECVKITSRNILEKPIAGSAGDTLQNDSIVSFYAPYAYYGFPQVWAYNGYVTTGLVFYGGKYGYVDLVKDRIAKDTLYLNVNLNADKGSNTGLNNYSFYMPERRVLLDGGILPKNDSIIVAVSAKVADGTSYKYESKYWKYKLN